MKSFTVNFHQEDAVQVMNVHKLSEEDFNKVTEGGTRQLFELDTNVGFFIFFDGHDAEGAESYLVLHFEGENEEPSACYEFELKDFYQFMALYLNDIQLDVEADEEEYGPIHHLAHLMFHIIEEGSKIEV
ncbi:cytosolic protein [Bacillus songklensis]|uniref:Cytosolic protein n=1 Tax=Bacillus songklensis TaxID=1069116 RepID=A0ABV8B3C1_9BACI